MKIEGIELRHVRMRLRAPFETSVGVELDRDCLIIRVDSEGMTGWGECAAGSTPGYSYETTETAWHVLSEFFIPTVLGRQVEEIGDYHRRLGAYKGHNLARAGLEMALWDLLAKVQGKSLAAILGGVVERVPVGVSIGIQQDPDVLVDVVRQYIEAGYRRVKIKIKPGRDVVEVEAVRKSFPDLPLQVDANSAYTLEDGAVFKSLDDQQLLLIEQPLAEDDLIDHSRLQAHLQTPICLDESIISARHARQALEIDACRVVNIKSGRVGGLLEGLAVHDLCYEAGVPVWCGGMLETGIGRAANLALASLPGFTLPGDISASDRYYAEDIAEPRFTLNADSTIDVPTGAGLGVEVVSDALERVTLRREVYKL
ncbi:MAG: o-succinylbenzoate synthase [Anaerolineales bacterium]|nr:MAG: o-succinylbenzoate synthase [Anaerolineales bacterium]